MTLQRVQELKETITELFIKANVEGYTSLDNIKRFIIKNMCSTFTEDENQFDSELNLAANKIEELLSYKGLVIPQDVKNALITEVKEYREQMKRISDEDKEKKLFSEILDELLCNEEYNINSLLKNIPVSGEDVYPKYFLITNEGLKETSLKLIGLIANTYTRNIISFARQEDAVSHTFEIKFKLDDGKGTAGLEVTRNCKKCNCSKEMLTTHCPLLSIFPPDFESIKEGELDYIDGEWKRKEIFDTAKIKEMLPLWEEMFSPMLEHLSTRHSENPPKPRYKLLCDEEDLVMVGQRISNKEEMLKDIREKGTSDVKGIISVLNRCDNNLLEYLSTAKEGRVGIATIPMILRFLKRV